MVIEVRLNASLRRYSPSVSEAGVVTVDVPDGISLGELLSEMEMDVAEVDAIKVNGLESNFEQVLMDGDRVELYPANAVKA